ncbi:MULTISPECIES: 50S ribosomal protein L24e [Haloarcula]|uniref:50S ribosomal protein L24e n=1 Tax=Haloarcula TaxID=2237 RepID=UPI0023EB9582|nr:50S ribosomal protein L24e [Halomicroarcula sp. XH51]
MPRTRECDYCGADIEPGTGTMFVSNDGSTTHFCSSKCENNADLGREPRTLEWTESGRGPEGTAGEDDEADEEAETAAAEDEADAAAEDEADEEDAAPDLEAAEEDLDDDADEDDEEAEEAEA